MKALCISNSTFKVFVLEWSNSWIKKGVWGLSPRLAAQSQPRARHVGLWASGIPSRGSKGKDRKWLASTVTATLPVYQKKLSLLVSQVAPNCRHHEAGSSPKSKKSDQTAGQPGGLKS